MPQKFILLDRDGTLIFEPQDTFQVDRLDQLKVLDGVINELKKVIENEFKLLMVTNQDGLGSSKYPKENFDIVQKAIIEIFKENGIVFENILVCPHFLSDGCDCRKPKIGLVDEYLKNNAIDLKNSVMVGDRDTDRQFAENLGIKFIPIKTNGIFPNLLN